jgi:hypothetical protein
MIFVSLRVTCSNNGTIPVYHSTESEISVVLIGDSVAHSLVLYVAITACPSVEPEISVGFIEVYVAQSLVVYVGKTAALPLNLRSRSILLEILLLNL